LDRAVSYSHTLAGAGAGNNDDIGSLVSVLRTHEGQRIPNMFISGISLFDIPPRFSFFDTMTSVIR
jgi:hypothetical protein